MQRRKFTKDYNLEIRSPKGALLQMVEYKAGQVGEVLEAHVEQVDGAGVAQPYEGSEDESGDGKKTARRK